MVVFVSNEHHRQPIGTFIDIVFLRIGQWMSENQNCKSQTLCPDADNRDVMMKLVYFSVVQVLVWNRLEFNRFY